MKRLLKIALALPVAAILGVTQDAVACSACFGKSNDKMFDAYFIGALTLIGLIAMVLAVISGFFIYLARRAAKFNADPSLTPNSN